MLLTRFCSVLLRKRKDLSFPEKHRMTNTYVYFQAVSNVPPLCLPIRPWDRVTTAKCHDTKWLAKYHCTKALSMFIFFTFLLHDFLLSLPPTSLFHGGQLCSFLPSAHRGTGEWWHRQNDLLAAQGLREPERDTVNDIKNWISREMGRRR